MEIGLTGTRRGTTTAQYGAFAAHLLELSRHNPDFGEAVEFHHGGCVGFDRETHQLARELWGGAVRITIHPASNVPENLCDWSDADELRDPLPNKDRNRNIVIAGSSLLIACPAGPESDPSQRRSGTWQTVRIARTLGRGVLIFWPDGRTE